MSNHTHRFFAAVSVLAGHGNIKQRLIQAYEENLAIVDEHDLPIVIKPSFVELQQMVTQVAPLNGEGRIRASVRKMSVSEADACAKQILEMYRDILRYDQDENNAQDSIPLRVAEQPAIPPFLVKSV